MWITVINKFIKNQKGQAIFEMIMFLPFLFMLYSIFFNVGNAINGSINQQKATRGYFYQLAKNDAYIPIRSDLVSRTNVSHIGFFMIGWREKTDGSDKENFSTCYSFNSLLFGGASEECDKREIADEDARASFIIKPATVYGVCGPTWTRNTTGTGPDKAEAEILPKIQVGIPCSWSE